MENKPAFPVNNGGKNLDPGMTLRDYFAAAALQGLLSGDPFADCGYSGYARDAYKIADQMMKAREE